MRRSFVVLVVFLEAVAALKFELDDPIVRIGGGYVKGAVKTSRNGRFYRSFTKIPYAKPPVGDLRFKSPEETERWSGIYDARQNIPACVQKNYLFANPKVEGQEDCLYLNVYAPKVEKRLKRQIYEHNLLPVMVFIHWGGFFAGYSGPEYLGPEYFMDEDIVLVTFNYRLGVMGFFSTGDDAAPGNYGLKDQVAALRWVQQNIEHFGGDKKSVTLFGQSAGGASVHYHMLSPLSKNLFHRGISQSGTALALWAKALDKTRQRFLARLQGRFSGCPPNSTNPSLVDCLRNVAAETLLESGENFKFFTIDPVTIYIPSIETATDSNPNPFVTKSPEEYVRLGEFRDVPWIVGVVQNEGLIRAEALLRQTTTRFALNANFNRLMPNLLALDLSVHLRDIPGTWELLKGYYFKGKNRIDVGDEDDINALINIYTDRSFLYSSYQSALYHKYHKHTAVWFYNFNFRGRSSYGEVFAATNETLDFPWGVSHCDDLIYLFGSPALFPKALSREEKLLSEVLVRKWVRFATYSDPNGEEPMEWEKMDNFENGTNSKVIKYLNVDGTSASGCSFAMKKSLQKLRLKFWESLPLMENFEELNQTTPDDGNKIL